MTLFERFVEVNGFIAGYLSAVNVENAHHGGGGNIFGNELNFQDGNR
jgi:hypothetical protein